MTSACEICQIIHDCIIYWSEPNDGQHISVQQEELGTWAQLFKNANCGACQEVAAYLIKNDTGGASPRSPLCTLAISAEEGRYTIGSTPFCHSDTRPEHVCTEAHSFLELYPSALHRFNGDGEYFHRADPHWVDVQRAKRWLDFCESQHGTDCAPDLNKVFPGPARMIDLHQECIVPSEDWPRYCALSYVWGAMLPGLATLKSNISALQLTGSLAFDSSHGSLAKTVKDAMILAKKLGFRYLWADRLCIIQDDLEDKKNEIKLMGSIYKNATLTIIAMDGKHADHGLAGISALRSREQLILDISPDMQLLGSPVREWPRFKQTWHTRAWTYQERLLSSRKLCFFKDSYFFECSQTHWTEGITAEADDDTVDNFYYRSLSAVTSGVINDYPFADLKQYRDLVEEYCTRQIGFDADALDACGAILARLRPTYLGGFHFGLPEFYFDIAMLWTPIKPMTRRPEFPSWSWLGWKDGSITHAPYCDPYFPTVQYDSDGSLFDLTITPTTIWYKTSRLFPQDEHRLVEIDNTYHCWRAKVNERNIPGWDKTGEIWNNRSLIERPFDFRYPIPVGERINARHELNCQEHCKPYLSFTTHRAMLRTGDIAGKAFTGHDTYYVNLSSKSDDWVGVISSHITDPAARLEPEICEVIVISQGEAKGKSLASSYLEVRQRPELEKIIVYHFFNILVVEHNDGFAYRKAVGRVWKQAWDELQIEMVDVKLA